MHAIRSIAGLTREEINLALSQAFKAPSVPQYSHQSHDGRSMQPMRELKTSHYQYPNFVPDFDSTHATRPVT